jgi:hypothetical protein
MITTPDSDEYGEFYENYISRMRGRDISALINSQVEELRSFFSSVGEEQSIKSYQEGKWTYKQLLGHINDTEKIMFFRALCLARNEQQPLPGFDQDVYVNAANFNGVSLSSLLEDFELVRRSISFFIDNLTNEAASRQGKVNDQTMSVRALLHIIPGHFEHHLEILKSISQTDSYK